MHFICPKTCRGTDNKQLKGSTEAWVAEKTGIAYKCKKKSAYVSSLIGFHNSTTGYIISLLPFSNIAILPLTAEVFAYSNIATFFISTCIYINKTSIGFYFHGDPLLSSGGSWGTTKNFAYRLCQIIFLTIFSLLSIYLLSFP